MFGGKKKKNPKNVKQGNTETDTAYSSQWDTRKKYASITDAKLNCHEVISLVFTGFEQLE